MTGIRAPSETDLARIAVDSTAPVDRLLDVVEHEIVPLTRAGVRDGNKIFGGAVLRKSDLSTVVAVTNQESVNPLDHGEIATINTFYDIPLGDRPLAAEKDARAALGIGALALTVTSHFPTMGPRFQIAKGKDGPHEDSKGQACRRQR